MKKDIINIFKGVAMGASNVIPGVSGGTMALITGIFERLIDAIKSLDIQAVKLFFTGRFKEFAKHTDFRFLVSIFIGIVIAVVSVARLFEYLFEHYPLYIWAFFFGLIFASVYFVGKTVAKWSVATITCLIAGTGIAVVLSFMNPASENDSLLYLFICGIVAISSMIVPGLSGSFVLIIMGNYELIAIKAINDLNIMILLPVLAGAGIGLLGFSHLLSFVLKKFRHQTTALLTGFVLGSLLILWPWKTPVYQVFAEGKEKVVAYERFFPSDFTQETIMAFLFIIAGIACVWGIEKIAGKQAA